MATSVRIYDEHDTVRREQLVRRLSEQAEDVRLMMRGLSEEAMNARVEDKKWSLKEIVAHLYRCQKVFEARIVIMVTDDNPAVTVYDFDVDPEFNDVLNRPAQELVMGFVTTRALVVGQLTTYSDAEWGRPGRHPQIEDYNVEKQVEHMLYHEAHHIYEIMQRRAHLDTVERC